MKQVIVGVYFLGFEQVELVLREGDGGEFYTCPETGKIPRIKVGAYSDGEWQKVVAVLIHELMEFAMFRADARFNPDNRVKPISHADYLFVMDHQKFQDCCSKVAEFLAPSLPDLANAREKFLKKKT